MQRCTSNCRCLRSRSQSKAPQTSRAETGSTRRPPVRSRPKQDFGWCSHFTFEAIAAREPGAPDTLQMEGLEFVREGWLDSLAKPHSSLFAQIVPGDQKKSTDEIKMF